jgi:hypothetical protein
MTFNSFFPLKLKMNIQVLLSLIEGAVDGNNEMACVEFGKVISPYKGEVELVESSDKEKKKKKK